MYREWLVQGPRSSLEFCRTRWHADLKHAHAPARHDGRPEEGACARSVRPATPVPGHPRGRGASPSAALPVGRSGCASAASRQLPRTCCARIPDSRSMAYSGTFAYLAAPYTGLQTRRVRLAHRLGALAAPPAHTRRVAAVHSARARVVRVLAACACVPSQHIYSVFSRRIPHPPARPATPRSATATPPSAPHIPLP